MRSILFHRRVLLISFLVVVLAVGAVALATRTPGDSASRASRSTATTDEPGRSGTSPGPRTSEERAASVEGQTEAPAAAEEVVSEQSAELDPDAVARASCGLQEAAIEALLGPADLPASADDRLRDAIPVLQENLVDWQQAVDLRPELAPVLSSAQQVLASWETALAAFDAGDQTAADAALAASRAELESIAEQSVPSDTCGG